MIVPIVLLLLSVSALAATFALPDWHDFLLLALASGVASLFLLVRALVSGAGAPRAKADSSTKKWAVVDGSNVMHWKDETPSLEPVLAVIAELSRLGITPGVVFDANAGYKLTGKYQHHRAMGRLLGLPEDRIMVVPKGTVADIIVLQAARDLGARIVSNDRYRDWAEAHPEVQDPGHVIRGGYRDGKLWLDA